MKAQTSTEPDPSRAAMGPDVSYLWHLMGEDLILSFSEPLEFEGRLTAYSCLALTHQPGADFNMALIYGGADAAVKLREYQEAIAAAELSAIVMLSGAVAADLAPVAEGLGLTDAGTAPFMVYLPQRRPPLIPEEYTVERVRDAPAYDIALQVTSRAFGLPLDGLRCAHPPSLLDTPGMAIFLARRDGEPRSAVFTLRHGPFVGLYTMGTPPEYQHQGAGRALLEHVIADYLARGVAAFYLVATEQGYPLYDRIGFITVDSPAIWLAGTSTQFS